VKRLGLFALVLATALSACSRSDTGTTGSGGRHSWTQPGILRMASLVDPDTLNPLLSASQVSVDLSMFWGGYLFNFDDRNELVPELATTVPTLANGGIARDGRTITYHLRRGVTWHDGAPFDAGDIAFSWRAIMNPATNAQTRTGYDDVSAIDTPDRYTAVVHLKRSFAPFVNTFLTMSSTPYPVLPRHLLAKYHDLNQVAYNSAPVGTGPFIVQEWHRGQTLRMIANPHYWRGAPKLKEVDYRVIPDSNTLATSMQTHEIDFWYNAQSTLYPTASKIAGTHAVLTPFTQYSQIGFNTARPVVADPRVRRALAYATDRQHLIDLVTFGVETRGDGDQPSSSWAHDPHLPAIAFDPAKARALLDAAGWHVGPDGIRVKNGQRLRLEDANITGNAVGSRLAILLQAAWKDVGAELEVKNYSSGIALANAQSGGIFQSGKFDVEFSSWVNGIDPDDSTTLMCDQFPPNGQNIFHYCNPQLDAAERIALTSNDQAVRTAQYAKIQRIIVDEVPFINSWFWRRFDVLSDDFHGYKPAHAVTTFWNTWEYSI
jgi:peptide/nickel transport system substrate-binding protein